MTAASRRRFGRLHARQPLATDAGFLAALYLSTRPDLAALPVPRPVIEGIARHQQARRDADYAARYPDAQAWVIEDGDQAVGLVLLSPQGAALRVVDLAVAGHVRRRGLARTVLRALQDECRGERPIALRVRSDNLAARALYDSLGFVTEGAASDTLELRWPQR